jgi:hypothetical protein
LLGSVNIVVSCACSGTEAQGEEKPLLGGAAE